MKLDNRIWAILTTLVVVALFAGGWFLGASPLLDQVNASEAERAEVIAHNQQLEADLATLAKAKEGLPEMIEAADLLAKSIPGDTDSSNFIRALNELAAAAGVTITAIEMQDGQPYQPPVAQDAAAAPVTEGAAPVVPQAPSRDPAPHTDPLITPDNFVVVPISITVEGAWPNVLDFIDRLQHGERLALVSDVKATRNSGDSFTTVLGGTIYVLPDGDSELDETQKPDESQPTPEPSATPEPTTTPDPTASPDPSGTPTAG